jgi:hypothetical protein
MPQPPPAADFREPTFMVPILAKENLSFFLIPLPVRYRIYKAEPVFPDSPGLVHRANNCKLMWLLGFYGRLFIRHLSLPPQAIPLASTFQFRH